MDESDYAQALAFAYANRRRKAGSGYHASWNASDSEKFVKAARLAMEAGASPDEWVESQFQTVKGRPVYITDLYAKGASSRYAKYAENSRPDWAWELDRLMTKLVMLAKNTGEPVEKILASPGHTFPAWFRVCALVSPTSEITERWGEEAAAEMGDPDLAAAVAARRGS